ncbi:MAG: hypothetical protein H7Y42_19640 [Chitinophagaceae bacterium]|nr:hypothetical protein [Chitinophagaceae bacterium]
MNTLLIRIGALLLHALANFFLLTYLTDYDLTGSWLAIGGFVILLVVLLVLFIKHILSFVYFLKTKTK